MYLGYEFMDFLRLGLGSNPKDFNSRYVSHTKYTHNAIKLKLNQLFIQQWQNLLTYALDIPQITGFENSSSSKILWCKIIHIDQF